MSLRVRLTALVVGAFAVGLVILGILVPTLVRGDLTERLDADLRAGGEAAAYRALTDLDRPAGRPGALPVARNPLLDSAYVEVRNVDGTVSIGAWVDDQLGERAAPELPAELPEVGTGFTVGSVGPLAPERYRVMAFTAVNRRTGQDVALVVAVPTTEVDETVGQVVRATVITAAATLVGVASLAWLLVRLGLRPLRRMERTAAAIATAGDLHQRIEHPGARTELGALGATLNTMLARLEDSFAAQRDTEARLRRFVSDASHELRTPLTSIRGYAELHRRGGDTPEQVGRSMGRIEDEAGRMSRLVDDLLLLARLDESSPLEREQFDVAMTVGDLVGDLRAVDPERPVSLRAEQGLVVGDRHRLAQAVANVLTNARVHTPPGTPIDVRVATADGGRAVEIEVADRGPGLPASARERVFDRFYRTDVSRTRAAGGSGLGLAISAAIVEAHGGTIAVTDTPGGGATFRIRLPAAPASPRGG